MPTLEELEAVARGASPRPFDASDRERIGAARAVVEAALESGTAVYGVTTGFGRLENVRIATSDAAQLQVNLLRSHAVGAGPPLPEEVVRGMLLLLASSLRRGHSGVRAELVELVLGLLDRGVVPVIPSKGSVGSSGDLAPLAHLGLVLIGEGEATYDGEALPGGEAVALSLEAFKGSTVPFDARLHELRGQPGPAVVAARLRALLDGSPVVASHADCGRVQDPYTLRCAPQVLGAVADALDYVNTAIERELGAVTDNPLVVGDDILSGGNFHGQPLSLPLDHLALALCELASFSERRIYALLSPGYAGLPPFLTPRPGLSSGLMIAQYAAAALVNESQVLSHPAGA